MINHVAQVGYTSIQRHTHCFHNFGSTRQVQYSLFTAIVKDKSTHDRRNEVPTVQLVQYIAI